MTALESLWQRGEKFLGISYSIISGAMTWISDSHFVSAVCKEGAFGCLAAGNMEPSLLDLDNKKEN
ncbi:MAG: nitronate monooxygenase [Candidatus Aminicenantes bacterium]|nr:nitronate monooxygenase [Candidatus Aminicenantes bacterium]